MFSKTPPISYPGELPDLDHQTISLRTQLRLSYETYGWLRYLTWSGLLLLAALLLILPGGLPPRVAVLLWQNLLVTRELMALHGSAALISLLALALQTLTWLVLWILLFVLAYKLIRYTWHMYSAQKILASGWLSSSALSNGKAPITLARTTPLASRDSSPMSAQSAERAQHQPLSTRNATPGMSSSASQQRSLADSSTQVLVRSLPTSAKRAPAQPQADTSQQVQSRQFASAGSTPTAARSAMPSGEFSFGWSLHPTSSAPGIAWDPGIKRKGRPNEDSVLTIRGTCNPGGVGSDRLLPFELHIVADGMGGHAQGRLASHLAIRSMLETVVPGLVSCNAVESEQIVDILIDGVHWANEVIYQYGQENDADMGTTITAVLLLDESAYIINVGDSRTYIYRPNVGLTQITRDHSLVARLVETGAITPDEVYTHPDRNKVYRGLGDKTDVTVDWFVLPVQSNDLLLLCSDGLWEMVRDPQIAEILQTYAGAPALASNALLRTALQAGGSDNVSTLVVRVA